MTAQQLARLYTAHVGPLVPMMDHLRHCRRCRLVPAGAMPLDSACPGMRASVRGILGAVAAAKADTGSLS